MRQAAFFSVRILRVSFYKSRIIAPRIGLWGTSITDFLTNKVLSAQKLEGNSRKGGNNKGSKGF